MRSATPGNQICYPGACVTNDWRNGGFFGVLLQALGPSQALGTLGFNLWVGCILYHVSCLEKLEFYFHPGWIEAEL